VIGSLETTVCASTEVEDRVEAFLDACPNSFAQQTPAWSRVIQSIGHDEVFHIVCRSKERVLGVLPAYHCSGPLGSILTSAAQAGALGGVACTDGVDPQPVYQALLEAFIALARDRDCALATLYSNPIWPDHALCERYLQPDYVLENACQVLDMDRAVSDDGSFPLASENVRRNIRKSATSGLMVDEEATPTSVDQWYALHVARQDEIGACPLPRSMFTGALREMVPRGLARFVFVRLLERPQEMVAGGFYVLHGQVIDALMPAFSSAYGKLAPNFLLAASTIRWARNAGLRYYNWQASPPAGGVRHFKLQWGSEDVPYYILTRITGDVSGFHQATPQQLQAGYPGHYVLPFDALGGGPKAGPRRSERKRAWKAGEEDRP